MEKFLSLNSFERLNPRIYKGRTEVIWLISDKLQIDKKSFVKTQTDYVKLSVYVNSLLKYTPFG